ncbi:MAG: lipase maturation factor family protein [Myxococcota bacterium]|nr:lipase maturation factor family protein [Myxococcota bacterium]
MRSAHDDLIEVSDWDRQTERRALLIYDGACGFCRACAGYAQALVGEARLAVGAGGVVGAQFQELSDEDLETSVWVADEQGALRSGAAAVFYVLAMAAGYGLPWFLYRRLPGFAPVTEWGYRLVASRRHQAAQAARWLWGEPLLPSNYRFSTALYLRLLGLVYVFAFASLALQLPGLVGEEGILPLRDYLARVQQGGGAWAVWYAPTIGWLFESSSSLVISAWAGALAGVMLVLGRWPRWTAAAAWALHLSLVTAGQNFTYYQWDSLLCEAGFLAIFVAPRGARLTLSACSGTQSVFRWLSLWLLWRLVFVSAYVKLASGDPSWASCTALEVHYETQPLPNLFAYWAHQLPAWVQQLSCAGMLGIEFIAPCLLVMPRRLRHAGAVSIVALMSAIALTGNYGYFNLLTAALALLALDDRFWGGWTSKLTYERPERAAWSARIGAGALLLLTLVGLERHTATQVLAPLRPVQRAVAPLRLTASYGLFAVMTQERPELVIEGSLDGAEWAPYELPFKPGRLDRRPPQVAPHMPRLDWQLWFAALGRVEQNRWLVGLLEGLLRDAQAVRSLFAKVPFDQPPKQLRILRYRYRMTPPGAARWWAREPLGVYLKPVYLSGQGKVTFAQPADVMRPDP